MSMIYGKPSVDWIEENHPENGLFRVYWKDVVNWDEGGLTFDPDEGEGLRWEWYYKDGARADGESKGWFPNGKLKQLTTFKNGVKTSHIENNVNGVKQVEWNFKDGELVGLFNRWYDNGQERKGVTFKDGIPIFDYERNEDGSVKE